jgi:hypothetical protein
MGLGPTNGDENPCKLSFRAAARNLLWFAAKQIPRRCAPSKVVCDLGSADRVFRSAARGGQTADPNPGSALPQPRGLSSPLVGRRPMQHSSE